MLYRVTHVTAYAYEAKVSISHNETRISPRRTPGQTPRRTQLLVEPAPVVLTSATDYFGNTVHFFSLEEGHDRLSVTAVSEIDVSGIEPPAAALTPNWESVPGAIRRDRSSTGLEALGYTFDSPYVRESAGLRDYAAESFRPGRAVLEAAFELTQRIYRDFKYESGVTSIATPLSQVMKERRGVCQDFAHLEIAMLRSFGLPTRYVSGYLRTRPAPGRTRLAGADASHAWLSMYCPGFGYVDLDPTNGVIPKDEHVTVAWGRDFSDVSPVRGVILGGGEHSLRVSVDVAAA
jgi:transglutaminase-like putative cysteine protease